jgi:predicted HD phosphohydrolase
MQTQTSFSRMDAGTLEQWQHIMVEHQVIQQSVPERIKAMLRQLEFITGGFAVNQLVHCLQTATRAERAGASDEMVLASLCHDIGKVISVPNHPAIAAEILKPYVSEEVYWVILTHQDFQGRHYYQLLGKDPNARQQYKDHPYFALGEKFADEWDQTAFDPDYDTLPLEHFEPLIDRFFAQPRSM